MEEIDLKELFDIFWNRKILIIFVVIIFAMIGAIYSFAFKTPMYSSSTTLVLAMSETTTSEETNSITTTDMTLNSSLVSTYSKIVESNDVLREVISNLGIDESEDTLRNNIDVSAVDDTEIIEITVSHENAVYAAKIANEIADVFSEKVNEIYNINNVYILDEAEIENAPSNVNHLKDMIIFALVGLVLVMLYVFVLNLLDDTIKSPEEIEKEYGLYVLVSIPDIESFEVRKGGKK